MGRLLTLTALLLALVTVAGRATRADSIYWTDVTGTIRGVNADGSGQQTLVSGLMQPAGIALDVAGGKMYWTDFGGSSPGDLGDIRRANLDGSGQQTLVSGLRPIGIALDVAGGKMYWTDTTNDTISRANLDGTGQQTLVSGLNLSAGIVLDVAGGKMYYTDTDFSGPFGTGYIGRANLDGTGQQKIISGLQESRGLALDVAGGKVYWTDLLSSDVGVIDRANLDGTGQQTLVSQSGDFLTGIALDVAGGKMYYSNLTTGVIDRANLDGTGQQTLVSGLAFGVAFAPGISVVPEPSGLILLGTGLLGALAAGRLCRGQARARAGSPARP
jgi:DNA-binding beta-propeller fold protein YncE